MGKTLEDTEIGKAFLERMLTAWEISPRIDIQDYMKLKSFSTAKKTIPKVKTESSQNGKESLPTTHQVKLLSGICKEL